MSAEEQPPPGPADIRMFGSVRGENSEPPEPGYHRNSVAYVAAHDGHGIVLDYSAMSYLDCEINVVGLGRVIDDLGLGDAPDGLSIWEGTYITRVTYDGEYECDPAGAFRPLTDEEWATVRAGGSPIAKLDGLETP